MKILMTSDLHYRPAIEPILRNFMEHAVAENPDVISNAGDWVTCEQSEFQKIVALFREYFPTTPIIGVLGNHDYWNVETKWGRQFKEDEKRRKEILAKYYITNLDASSVVLGGILFAGFYGWFSSFNPPTNDKNFLPKIVDEIPIHEFLHKKSIEDFSTVLKISQESKEKKKFLVSHFPTFSDFDDGFVAPHSWHKFVLENFDYAHFGHTHERVERTDGKCHLFNAGAGNGYHPAPAYIIKEVN